MSSQVASLPAGAPPQQDPLAQRLLMGQESASGKAIESDSEMARVRVTSWGSVRDWVRRWATDWARPIRLLHRLHLTSE